MTYKKAINIGLLFTLLIAIGTACSRSVLTPTEVAGIKNSGKDYVILMHGLWNSSSRMEKFEDYFTNKGYQVLNIDYPTTETHIQSLESQYLRPIIESIPFQTGQKVHFVTHSMGGIVLRDYLRKNKLPQLGRIVMISPPNGGSEWANLLIDNSFYRWLAGPAAYDLRTVNNDFLSKLGAVTYELGIIAGDKTYLESFQDVIPGPDDGMVAIESMKLPGMRDLIVIHEHHRGLTWNPEAMKQAWFFIKSGQFRHAYEKATPVTPYLFTQKLTFKSDLYSNQ